MAGAIYALMKGFEGAYVDSFLRIGSGAHRSLRACVQSVEIWRAEVGTPNFPI